MVQWYQSIWARLLGGCWDDLAGLLIMSRSLTLAKAMSPGPLRHLHAYHKCSQAIITKVCVAGDASCGVSGRQQLPAGFQRMLAQHQFKEQHLRDWWPCSLSLAHIIVLTSCLCAGKLAMGACSLDSGPAARHSLLALLRERAAG